MCGSSSVPSKKEVPSNSPNSNHLPKSQSPPDISLKGAFVMDSDIAATYAVQCEEHGHSGKHFSSYRGVRLTEGTTRPYEFWLLHFLHKLRSMLSKSKATFRSLLQFSATVSVSERTDNGLLVMPTGSGKSICFLLPVFMERKCFSTIMIVPLRSLVNEMKSRANAYGTAVSTIILTPSSNHYADLYILLPEQVRLEGFQELVQKLLSDRRLARVVVDEAHLTASWSSFRQILRDLRYMPLEIPSRIPRLLLTATIPPSERHALMLKHEISSASVLVTATVRKMLVYSVAYADDGGTNRRSRTGKFQKDLNNLMNCALSAIDDKLNDVCSLYPQCTSFRALVYIAHRKEVEKVADILSAVYETGVSPSKAQVRDSINKMVSVLFYHAGMSREMRNKIYKAWRDPNSIPPHSGMTLSSHQGTVMVCTWAFGAGIDAPDLRLVIYVGGSTYLSDHVQETGRAGRDGKKSFCVTVYSSAFGKYMDALLDGKASEAGEEGDLKATETWREEQKWIENRTMYGKNWLFNYMEGEQPGMCLLDPDFENCDVCERIDKQGEQVDRPCNSGHTENWELVSPSPESKLVSAVEHMGAPPSHLGPNGLTESQNDFEVDENSIKGILDICGFLIQKFEDDCLACYIAHGRVVKNLDRSRNSTHTCFWKQGRCFHCYSRHHRVFYCQNQIVVRQGCCFKCGLSYSRGSDFTGTDWGTRALANL